MRKATLVTVNLLIVETRQGEIADAVSGILTEQMQQYAGANSSLLDWQHVGQREVEIEDDYLPDDGQFPRE